MATRFLSPRLCLCFAWLPPSESRALVEMNHPGVWVLGEVRKHIMAAGMGIVVEYGGSSGKPQWDQPNQLTWDYLLFAAPGPPSSQQSNAVTIPLVFESKFAGHGAMDHWTINGKSYPGYRQPRADRRPALSPGVHQSQHQ